MSKGSGKQLSSLLAAAAAAATAADVCMHSQGSLQQCLEFQKGRVQSTGVCALCGSSDIGADCLVWTTS